MKKRERKRRAKLSFSCAAITVVIILAARFYASPFFASKNSFYRGLSENAETAGAAEKMKTAGATGESARVCADEPRLSEKAIGLPIDKNFSFVSYKNKKEKVLNDKFTVKTERGTYEYYYPQFTSALSGEKIILGLQSEIDRIYADNYVAPENAEIKFTASGKTPFEIISEKSGRKIERKQIAAAINYALSSGKNNVVLRSESVPPRITARALKEKCVLRSTFSTYYGNSAAERKNNVYLAAKSINGSVLKAGERFSFNETVGERSEARGYKNAKIIVGGEFIDGVGGGVCQVSTTVYNAALKAGLNVTEWHRHSLPVSYVNPSFDAMVSGTFCDLVFVNETESEVYITCFADGENLTVSIYGLKSEYEYRQVSVITEVIKAGIEKEYDENIPAGETKEIARAHDGLKSEGYLCVYKNGELIKNVKIRSDEYAARKGLVKIGVKKVDN